MAKTLFNVGVIPPGVQSTKDKERFLQLAMDHYQQTGTMPEYLLKYIMEGVQAELDGKKPWPTKRGRKDVIPVSIARLYAGMVDTGNMSYDDAMRVLTGEFDTDQKTVAKALAGK